MENVSTVLWFFGIYGLVFFLNDSTIFTPFRKVLTNMPILGASFFRKLFSCYFCMGIWVAFAVWLLIIMLKQQQLGDITTWTLFPLYVFGGAGAAYALERITLIADFLESYFQHKIANEEPIPFHEMDTAPLPFPVENPISADENLQNTRILRE